MHSNVKLVSIKIPHHTETNLFSGVFNLKVVGFSFLLSTNQTETVSNRCL